MCLIKAQRFSNNYHLYSKVLLYPSKLGIASDTEGGQHFSEYLMTNLVVDFFRHKASTIEENIFVKSVLAALSISFLLTINALILFPNWWLPLLDMVATCIFFLIYYRVRYLGRYKELMVLFLISVIIILDLAWFISGGYNSPNAYLLILVFVDGAIILSRNQIKWLAPLLIVNILALYMIEYTNLVHVMRLPVQMDIVGHAVIMIVTLIFASYLMNITKREYERDRIKVISGNKLLTTKNRKIEEQNRKLELQSKLLNDNQNLLTSQNKIIENKNKELKFYSTNLEKKVKQKSEELVALNKDLLKKNSKLEQFAFVISHNLRAPIAQVKGIISLFPSYIKDELKIDELLSLMNNSTRDLERVVNDIAQIIDIRKGGGSKLSAVNVEKQYNIALGTLNTSIEHTGAIVSINIDSKIKIRGIKAYMQSIFYNLLHNSIKYARQNVIPEICVDVKVEGSEVRIDVKDNGIGIDMKYAKNKIFNLYQRFNNEYPGKGMGLFLIRTQLETMQGRVKVKSELGKGSVFSVWLPIA